LRAAFRLFRDLADYNNRVLPECRFFGDKLQELLEE